MGRHFAQKAAETREQATLRRITTSVVAAVAGGALACSLTIGPAATQAAQGQAHEQAQGEAGRSEGGEDVEGSVSPLVDATATSTAEGAALTHVHVLVRGDRTFGSTTSYAQLTQAIAGFEAQGWSLGVSVYDLETGAALSYQADRDFYCASTIKAPFTVAGYQTRVDTGEVDASAVDELARTEIIDSDNDAYLSLRDVLGTGGFVAWLTEAGVSPGIYPSLEELAETHYPHLTCNQLSAMWRQTYAYLSSGEGSAQKLIRLLRSRRVSPIRDALGTRYETWSKAGWIDVSADGGVSPATWDAGVVLSDEGPYVLVVGSTAPSELEALVPVIQAADAAHSAIVEDAQASDDTSSANAAGATSADAATGGATASSEPSSDAE